MKVILNSQDIKQAVVIFKDLLRDNQEVINRLNVYPVPDGDTGTNMALTLVSVIEEIEAIEDEPTMAQVTKAISHGSLMGARGNSGIILSQILRGLCNVFQEKDEVNGEGLVKAFKQAALQARQAVLRPVEGTILTVATAAAESAEAAFVSGKHSILEVTEAASGGAQSALRMTPELLPVLAESKVVDAGGAGLTLLFEGFLSLIDDRQVPDLISILPKSVAEVVSKVSPLNSGHGDDESSSALIVAPHGSDAVGDLRYEVMYLLEANDDAIPAFKDVWGGVGDSIVIVGGEGIWNCHIHTGDIGAAIEAGIDTGRPRRIRVTDLAEQVEEEHWVRVAEESGITVTNDDRHTGPPPVTAVVAVATGEGVGRIFHSLGVHRLVTGGQSMNPSTADILKAVEDAPAHAVVILPNNKNIIPVALEVDGLTSKIVRVVPTKGVVEGFAALLAFDPEAGPGENLNLMEAAAQRVVAGEVTRAVRNASSSAGPIKEGDWLGLSREGIQVVESSLAQASIKLLEALIVPEHEIITVIEGDLATVGDTRQIRGWVDENYPDIAVEVHHGGQPLYPYLFSIE